MTPERWAQIREIFEHALESSDRAAFVAEACHGDEELQREVASLLAQHSDSGDPIFDRPAWEITASWMPRDSESAPEQDARTPWIPRAIGKYRILGVLGQGGMGAVYQAEQDHPRRLVALKVIRPGYSSPELLRRFEMESLALGRLQHPGIAQIYEGGTADAGLGPQPFFAMEFIRGETLREYLRTHRPNTRQRLELMAKICDAVEHAHQRGLIHRDLKPANIMVDPTGQPKILDFGVARVTDSDTKATRQTDVGQLVGTLAYMSPEQVLADPLALDTRSDVYSLGVLLYELLADRLPYKLSDRLHEAARTIREEDPARLSSIRGEYRGDIETIVVKALEKDKTRRYGSAAALAADLRHYLEDEPIAARPPSTAYQLQKFARRHRVLATSIAAIFVTLVVAVVVSTREALRATRAERTALVQRDQALVEKRRADDEAAKAKAVNDFLRDDLLSQASAVTQAQASTDPDPDIKVRTVLDRAATRIAGRFDKQPLIEDSIRQTIANAYIDLGLYAKAQPQVERALALERRTLGDRNPATLGSMNSLAQLYEYQGHYPQAEALYFQVQEQQLRVLGEKHPDTLTTMGCLGRLYLLEGKYPQAETTYAKAFDISRSVRGPENIDTLSDMTGLAVSYHKQGKNDQAEELYRKILTIGARVLGEQHPDMLTNMNNLAGVLHSQGKYAEAEALYAKLLAMSRKVLGEEHPNTLIISQNMARLYTDELKLAKAEELFTKVVNIERRTIGEEHPDTLMATDGLARIYQMEGDDARAEPLITKVLEEQRRVLGAEHPETLITMGDLGSLYLDRGQYPAAEETFAKVLDARRRALGPHDSQTIIAGGWLGEALFRERKYAKAEPLLRAALDNVKGPDNWRRYYRQALLGASLEGQNKFSEAEPLLVAGYQGMLQRSAIIPPAKRSEIRQAGDRIVEFYRSWQKPDMARKWEEELTRFR